MLLAEMGITEALAREHSFEWIDEAADCVLAHQKTRAAEHIQTSFISGAAAAHGGDCIGAMTDIVDELTEDAEDLMGTAEPNVTPDLGRLAEMERERVVIPLRVKVSPDPPQETANG